MIRAFKKQRQLNLTPNYIILILLMGFALGPLLVLTFNSLKGSAESGRNPLGFPTTIIWENYPNAWERGNFALTTRNSSIFVVGTVVGVLLLGGMAAYSLARLKLPGANLVMGYFLIASTLPVWLFLVPLFILWRNLGLYNTIHGLILIYIGLNSPFAIFLLRSYMVNLPADFEDAARVDGANEWQVFSRIVIPLSWPGFLTVGLVVALSVWNEFLLATVFLSDQKLLPVATSYYQFTTRFSRDWGLTSAAAIMMIAPILIIFLALQRRFIEGLTQGGVRG